MCLGGMKVLSKVNNIVASYELPRLIPKDIDQHMPIDFTVCALTHERAMVKIKHTVIDHDLNDDG